MHLPLDECDRLQQFFRLLGDLVPELEGIPSKALF
ncbi:MAG: hypothetical protein RLZZ117_31 [Cyanobacteriota bacterium]|jgi:hypothetical protein